MRGFMALVVVLASTRLASAEEAKTVSFGAGVLASLGLTGLGAPDPEGTQLGTGDSLRIAGMTGVSPGAGVALEARFIGILGLEVDALYVREALSGEFERDGAGVDVSVTQPALRIPVLVKGIWPLGDLAPFAALGPVFTLQGLSDASVDPSSALGVVANSDPAPWWLIGLGVEWRAPVPSLDLRVPVSLRGSINPNATSDLDDRAVVLPSDAIVLDTTPGYEVALTAGARVFF